MLRKLNFTERLRIPRAAVTIHLRREPDGVLSFHPSLALEELSLPPHARVYIEAHYRSSYMRFDCGTVEHLVTPAERRLEEIDASRAVRFRVKVVDNTAGDHRIVAIADDILVTDRQADAGARRPLLEAEFRDLGDVSWRIHYDSELPVLELNNRIDGIEQLAKSDPLFLALVHHAAVREILTQILLIERHETADDSDDWWSLWLRWGCELTDRSPGDDEEEKRRWIDEVVAAFSASRRSIANLQQTKREDR